jgi:Ferritin-like
MGERYALDDPNPAEAFLPYSTEIGPFDLARLNTMCLIEYPHWEKLTRPNLKEDRNQYGSIGEFYFAIGVGISILKDHVRGGVRQVDFFRSYYNGVPTTTITKDGLEGYWQAIQLLGVIMEQGEGKAEGDVEIPPEYRNTADGFHESWSHYRKFTYLRDMYLTRSFPATFAADSKPGAAGLKAQQILVRDFGTFVQLLNDMFQGKPYQRFGVVMAKLGGDVLSCWQNKAVPKFS